MKDVLFFVLMTFTVVNFSFSQGDKGREYAIRTVAFYNLENLFDTINDLDKLYELNPMFALKGNKSEVYWSKIDNLAKVISEIGAEKTNTSPAILGVAEIENRQVLEDLVNSDHIKDKQYKIIHYDSPDMRGIDVGFLYQERYFKPVSHKTYELRLYLPDGIRIYTRDQLLVSGYLDNEMIHIIVNHWPSRRGGEVVSSPKREKAAYLNTQIIKEIRETDSNAKIIIMGDFNDDPISTSIKKGLHTKRKKKQVEQGDIYNPFENMFRKGMNTLGYRDNINLFDQILVTSSLLEKKYETFQFFKAGIFNPKFLTSKTGRYREYPFRSFSYGKYTNGYSDHYPVYVFFIKERLNLNVKKSQLIK